LGFKIKALRLEGKSYSQIKDSLGISKSTVSYWLSGDFQSSEIKEILTKRNIKESRKRIQILIDANNKKWKQWRESALLAALKEFQILYKNPLFISGIMLYWGEGDSKPKNPLRLSNTDPRMIKIYISFLRNILKIPEGKIKIGLILYPDIAAATAENFWKKVTLLPQNNFMKTQYIKGNHPTKRLENGICMVVVNSVQFKIKVLEWIDLFSKKLTISPLRV